MVSILRPGFYTFPPVCTDVCPVTKERAHPVKMRIRKNSSTCILITLRWLSKTISGMETLVDVTRLFPLMFPASFE